MYFSSAWSTTSCSGLLKHGISKLQAIEMTRLRKAKGQNKWIESERTKSIVWEHAWVLAAEEYKVPKQTVWATIKQYKDHRTLCCRPGSGQHFKLTPKILVMIEERMRTDDETKATQLLTMVNAAGYNVSKSTIIRARRILGWTFHGCRYCRMIRTQNKETRMQWARENLHNRFENIVWTDESMIHYLPHHLD